jgi:hypothetical protein
MGLADWREVERFGIQQMQDGAYQPEVIALAAVTDRTSGLETLVDSAVSATGERIPNERQAGALVASETAGGILDGTIAPIVGARTLWRIARRVPDLEPQLRPFVALASEWEDDETHRPAYDIDILESIPALIAALESELA